MINFWKWLWLATILILAGQLVFYFPQLPEQIASSFDFRGHPTGYTSRGNFLFLWILAIALINGMIPLVRLLVLRGPAVLINLPNKEYWLANEANRQRAAEIMDTMLTMVAVGVNTMFIMIFQYTYELNTRGSASFGMWWTFLPLPLAAIIPIIYMFMKFRVPKKRA